MDEELRSVNLQTYKLGLWQLAKIFWNRERNSHFHLEVGLSKEDLGVAPASKTSQTVSSVKRVDRHAAIPVSNTVTSTA
jgi:hypothetical protein